MKYSSQNSQRLYSSSLRIVALSFVSILILISLYSSAETAHAGLLSYMNSLFGGEQASAKINTDISTGNSQTIALLQAATSYDPNPEKPGISTPLVGTALVADIALSDSYESDYPNTRISSYTVRDGDTISGIAKMFNVSVNTIMWANDISKATALRTGQTIIILPVTGISYTVGKGDTIKGIASKYKADIDEILQYNDLALDSKLMVGQTIIIPDAEMRPVTTSTKYVGNNPAHDTNGPSYPGYYARPVVGGARTQGLHGYNGIDIAAPIGTPIYASAAGTVIVSLSGGWNGGYGNLVIISHANGTQTVYAHTSKNLVTVGQRVEQGEKIALMGATGKATGSHIHFEIRGAKNPF